MSKELFSNSIKKRNYNPEKFLFPFYRLKKIGENVNLVRSFGVIENGGQECIWKDIHGLIPCSTDTSNGVNPGSF